MAQANTHYEPKDRLTHIQGHLSNEVALPAIRRRVEFIRSGQGDPAACASGLASHAFASAMYTWFAQHDLTATRQWFRDSARLERMAQELKPKTRVGAWDADLLAPLVANDEQLLGWHRDHPFAFDTQRCADRRTPDFLVFQARLALRGEWDLLESRCDDVLANPPGTNSLKKYQIDHRFYRALARADAAGMLEAIQELVTPKAYKARADDEGGYTLDLISTTGVIYTKLAWRRGFPIDPGSPLVPSAWLPLDPAPPRESPYGI